MYRLPTDRAAIANDPITLAFRRQGWTVLAARAQREANVLWRAARVARGEGRHEDGRAYRRWARRLELVAARCEDFRRSIPLPRVVA